jgi:hypothetical protein
MKNPPKPKARLKPTVVEKQTKHGRLEFVVHDLADLASAMFVARKEAAK